MRFRMLGPLEVMSADQPVPLGGTKPRATLGYLLLQANQVVPTSQLLAALWSTDNAPVTARKILQNAVWGLRGMLNQCDPGFDGAPAELVTRAPGYMIRVDPDHVDLHLFRRRVRQGRALLSGGSPHEAANRFCEALELWRGPVLSDLVETGTMWPELTAVQNTRLDVLEDYFEAKLRCGQHYAVLGELETTVEAEPLRERASGQLMLALYRCGRQADALGVYNRIRVTLVEDLGLEPGHELRRLQQAILAHDPTLNLAPAAVVLGGSAPVGVPGGRCAGARTSGRPAPPAAGRAPGRSAASSGTRTGTTVRTSGTTGPGACARTGTRASATTTTTTFTRTAATTCARTAATTAGTTFARSCTRSGTSSGTRTRARTAATTGGGCWPPCPPTPAASCWPSARARPAPGRSDGRSPCPSPCPGPW